MPRSVHEWDCQCDWCTELKPLDLSWLERVSDQLPDVDPDLDDLDHDENLGDTE